jgi:EpsI family protein
LGTADNLRLVALTLLLSGTAAFLSVRSKGELLPRHESLENFPRQSGPWVGSDLRLEPEILASLGPGDFLVRDYRNISTNDAPVSLFIAYFPSQRTGDTVHSPKNCLPGSGWQPVVSSRIEIRLPGHAPFWANRYVVEKGSQRGLVFYWFLAHGRIVPSEYWAKFYLVEDSIRLNRSDGSLIRVTTNIGAYENANDAQKRVLSFLTFVVPVIESYVPS